MLDVTIKIILPLGISFFTFRGISYLVDIGRGDIQAERSFIKFSAYFAFFPQLFAGPIVRASEFMPQIESLMNRKKRLTSDDFIVGVSMFAWGALMKIAMADTIATIVNAKFASYALASAADVFIGVVFYAFQIYGDFAGYSLMSLGVARIMGFKFADNFCRPYFSISLQEFWRRWHISLSQWLRDYLYIPLGGSRNGHTNRNLILTMLLGGLWHGASWNFIFWGCGHGLLLCGERPFLKIFSSSLIMKIFRGSVIFISVMVLWVFFRATSLEQAICILKKMTNIFTCPGSITGVFHIVRGCLLIALVVIGDIVAEFVVIKRVKTINICAYGLFVGFCISVILLFGSFQGNQFIYQQF